MRPELPWSAGNLGVVASIAAFMQGTPWLDELLVYLDEQGREQPVKTLADWARRRADVLACMQRVMGDLPGPERRVDRRLRGGGTPGRR